MAVRLTSAETPRIGGGHCQEFCVSYIAYLDSEHDFTNLAHSCY